MITARLRSMGADVTIALVNAYVLAGGDSRRMGTAKPALMLGGVSFLERVVRAASGAFSSVFVVVRTGQEIELPPGSVRLEEPPHKERSPMFGITAAMHHTSHPLVWILAADYPLLTPALLTFLRTEFVRSEADLLVPVTGGKTHMLCAGYSTRLLESIERRSDRGQFRLRELVPGARTRIVSETEIAAVAGIQALSNVNSLQDYEQIGGSFDARNESDASQR